jgi:hypothetical protein
MTQTAAEVTRPASSQLVEVLANRRWEWRRSPFPHIVGRNVFRPPAYASLVTAFEEYADSGAIQYTPLHDFVGGPLNATAPAPLQVFLTDEWRRTFSRLFDVPLISHRSAGIHRHSPGSRSGFVHNDIKVERTDTAVDCVRAVAILFYLNSPEWQAGDGGGTGLYRHWQDPVDEPESVVSPLDNSLLAFECSPFSYHSFLANRLPRDSVVVFLYRELAGYLVRWGPEGLSQYADG